MKINKNKNNVSLKPKTKIDTMNCPSLKKILKMNKEALEILRSKNGK